MIINAGNAARFLKNSCAPWPPPLRCNAKNVAAPRWKNWSPAAPFRPGERVMVPPRPIPPIPVAAVQAATAAPATEVILFSD